MRSLLFYLSVALATLLASVSLSYFLLRTAKNFVLEAQRESGRQFRGPYRMTMRNWATGLAVFFGLCVGMAWGLGLRPHFGLLVFFLVPTGLRRLWQAWRAYRIRCLERAAVTFLEALLGLLRVGLSFPSALFHLVHHLPGAFAAELSPYLGRFEEGKSLTRCLERFRLHTQLGQVDLYLGLLMAAYREGLSMVPLLEHAVPILTAEQGYRERALSLRWAATVQAAVASLIPWALFGVLTYFQPEVTAEAAHHRFWWLAVGLAMGSEAAGAFWLWKISSFY